MPKNSIINENLNFQMVKFTKGDEQSISINQDQTLNIGDKVLIRIIPTKDMKVSIFVDNKTRTTKIKEGFNEGSEVQYLRASFLHKKHLKLRDQRE